MNVKKSAISGEYLIGVMENNSVVVYRVYATPKEPCARWQNRRTSSSTQIGTPASSVQKSVSNSETESRLQWAATISASRTAAA